MLIAGDLFDHPRVGREWVDFVLNLMAPVLPDAGDCRQPWTLPSAIRFGSEPRRHRALHFFASTERKRLRALEMEVVACPAGDESRWQAVLRRDPNGALLSDCADTRLHALRWRGHDSRSALCASVG